MLHNALQLWPKEELVEDVHKKVGPLLPEVMMQEPKSIDSDALSELVVSVRDLSKSLSKWVGLHVERELFANLNSELFNETENKKCLDCVQDC